MEIEDKFISPFSDIIEEADDVDKTTGELTEKRNQEDENARIFVKIVWR